MRHKLLLADDSVTIQRVIELTFADEDIEVIAVGNGAQAIERVRDERPDIVLADVGMPDRDGYEVSAFVKGTPEFAHIPVLLLTGAFEPIDEGRARAAQCDGVLVKPFEPQLVINRVKDLISRAASRRGDVNPPEALRPPAQPAAAASGHGVPLAHPGKSQGSVDDYFERLDAAFSSLEGQGPAAGTASPGHSDVRSLEPRAPVAATGNAAAPGYRGLAEELADWHPENLEAATPRSPMHPASPAAPAIGGLTLAEAFASLLAAERGQVLAPAFLPAHLLDDALVEQITQRVVERMTSRAVSDTVLDVAERLVREEIDRIKSHAR
ncbi:MAG: response regulator [Vicinamibacterales bacterium]